MISLDGLGKSFGKKWAVRGLTLEVEKGEIFALLGPNGAGKTTAIKMLTGLLLPSEGRAEIAGRDVVKDPLGARAATGYVPDRAFLYEKLTVREHLSFVASIYGLKKEKAVPKIESLIETFGLGEIEDSFIEGCSQGMRQRMLFASALIHDPPALLIDEPFVGLDPFGVVVIKDLLRGLAASGVSILLATHSLHIASELCHRVGIIDGGRLAALKSKEALEGMSLEAFFMRELSGGNG